MSPDEQLCTFVVGRYQLGVPVARVQEVIRAQPLTPVPALPPVVAGLMNLRGHIVTAIDLRVRLGLPPRAHGELLNVVVHTADGPASLLVDVDGAVLAVTGDMFEPPPATLEPAARALVRGAYKLPDRLLLVLDAERAVTPENDEGDPA